MKKYFVLSVILLLALVACDLAFCKEEIIKIADEKPISKVPAWDARGTGPLPWQGISCVDITPDGKFIALGTIAPVGDPQIFVLDENGQVIQQYRAGERWINEIAISPDGALVIHEITTPGGTAGDVPIFTAFTDGKTAKVKNDSPKNIQFHYGNHSNHLSPGLKSYDDGIISIGQGGLYFTGPAPDYTTKRVFIAGLPVISMAANHAGTTVIGFAVSESKLNDKTMDLTVINNAGKTIWQRKANTDAAPAPLPENGIYGPPAPKYIDEKLYAPLSTAISANGDYIATADYQGWERVFANDSTYGPRFTLSKPMIQIYSSDGTPKQRFTPDTFVMPGWYDIAFTLDGKYLLASPHSWTTRGLGGQPLLPVDDGIKSIYLLDIATGDVVRSDFPDAVASIAMAENGTMAISCWDGNIYLRGTDLKPIGVITDKLNIGSPSILRMSKDGSKLLAAGGDGITTMYDAGGKLLWKTDLNKLAKSGDKPWTKNQKLGKIAPGIWVKGGQRTHSDMGNQYIIEAPDGLLLIDPNAGLSFEQNWAQIIGAGLDPMKVKYILLTHEHGDHAPGAYMWRVATGAKVVASREMTYTLTHHMPFSSGYGFHPPQPIDMIIDKDGEITLAGMKINVLRLPGHTYGSLGYLFEKDGKNYAATGDLIMPGGLLGYSGSLNFSAADVLDSLRKLKKHKIDKIMGGHGGGEPENFIDAGINAGEATGWGRMTPEKPDQMFGFSQKNYRILEWMQPITCAVYGDADGDGNTDIAVITYKDKMAQLKIYLNKNGKFADNPDIKQDIPGIRPDKIRMAHIGTGKKTDFVLCSEPISMVLMAQEDAETYKIVNLPGLSRVTQVMTGDFNNDGRTDLLLGGRFISIFAYATQEKNGTFKITTGGQTKCSFDMQLIDVNGDIKDDLVTCTGEIYLRQEDGKLSTEPDFQLTLSKSTGFTFMSAADFNNDGNADIALMTTDDKDNTNVEMHYNTGDPENPFNLKADSTIKATGAIPDRDGATIADWNNDKIPDLIIPSRTGAIIIPGSKEGLDQKNITIIKTDYNQFFDNRRGIADFNNDNKPDFATWGTSSTGASGVYIWLRQ